MLPLPCYIISYVTSDLLHYHLRYLWPVTLSLMLPLTCYIITYVTSDLLHYHLCYLCHVTLSLILSLTSYIIIYVTSALLYYLLCYLWPVTLSLTLPLTCYIITYVTSDLLHYHLRYLWPVTLSLMLPLPCYIITYVNSVLLRGGADKSLARITSRCRRTKSIVSLERGVCSCAELQVCSCYRGWKEAFRRRARFQQNREVSCYQGDFSFPARQGAEGNSRHSDRNIRGTCTILHHRQKLGGSV